MEIDFHFIKSALSHPQTMIGAIIGIMIGVISTHLFSLHRDHILRRRDAAAAKASLLHDFADLVLEIGIDVALTSTKIENTDEIIDNNILCFPKISFPESLIPDLNLAKTLGPDATTTLALLRLEVDHFNRLNTVSDRLHAAHGSLGKALKGADKALVKLK